TPGSEDVPHDRNRKCQANHAVERNTSFEQHPAARNNARIIVARVVAGLAAGLVASLVASPVRQIGRRLSGRRIASGRDAVLLARWNFAFVQLITSRPVRPWNWTPLRLSFQAGQARGSANLQDK